MDTVYDGSLPKPLFVRCSKEQREEKLRVG
jgi:hypothetical protein